MAFNEIILQCYVLDPVIDSTSNTLTKVEMHTEKQVIPLLSSQAIPQVRANIAAPTPTCLPSSSQDPQGFETPTSSPTRPTTSRPSVRATLLVKQLQQQVTRSPSFIREHGLESYSSPQRPPITKEPSTALNDSTHDLRSSQQEISDVELEKFEIDSDVDEEEEDQEEELSDKEEEDPETLPGNHGDAVNNTSPPVRRIRKPHIGRGNANGSVTRAEVDMVFVSGCVSGDAAFHTFASQTSQPRSKSSYKSQANSHKISIPRRGGFISLVCQSSVTF